LEEGCNERSGSGDGDAVSSVVSRTKVGTGGGLCLGSDSGAAVESDVRRRLLAFLALIELGDESSDTGVRREARNASLVRVFRRFSELLRSLPLTVTTIDGAGDGSRSEDSGRSSITNVEESI
jgi:hypothetical protein